MKTNNMITMKTLYMLLAFLGLQFNTLFAAANLNEATLLSRNAAAAITLNILAPTTPMEATFDDVAEAFSPVVINNPLAPATPMVADFSDGAPSMEINSVALAPVTPREADFEETSILENASTTDDLSPATPADATFEDYI